MALNTISISGRLTKDVELRRTPNGKAVASFTLAVDRDKRDAGADFINCVAWEGTAEFVNKYFSKGSPAIVVGRLQTRNYEDKNGNKRTATEVVASSVYFAGDKKTGGEFAETVVFADTRKYSAPKFEEMDDDGDTLPF